MADKPEPPPWDEIWLRFEASQAAEFRDIPIEIRLRQLLKIAGRRLGLRHVGLKEVSRDDKAILS